MSDEADKIAALEARVAASEARVAQLERDAKPPEPFKSNYVPPINPIDRVSMPASAMRDMVRAVPDGIVRDLVKGGRGGAPVSIIAAPPASAEPEPRGAGWREAAALSNPPGTALADKLMDVADAKDRAELIVKEAQRRVGKPSTA
jgi:hypothetical protein